MNVKTFLYVFLFMVVYCPNLSLAETNGKEREESLKQSVQTAIKSLSPESSFSYYNLDLSSNEINALKNTEISSAKKYNNYGNIQNLYFEMTGFIKTLSQKNEAMAKNVAQLIVRLVEGIVQGSGKETAWVSVRTFIPTSEFNLPRWHTDGYYYGPYIGNVYKFVMTLKGPATLFCNLPPDKKEKFYALQRQGTEKNEYNQQAIAAFLENSKEVISVPPPYQGAVFIVGSDYAAVHSEPPIKEERLFISVLPGNKRQIEEWKSKLEYQ